MNNSRVLKYGRFLIMSACLVAAVSGCHLAKKTTGSKVIMTEGENIVRKVISAQPDWQFAEIRMTGRAIEDANKIGFMGTVKIERDKQIYLLVRSTLGFEVARAYANRDSVWILSRMLDIKESGDWKLAAGKLGYPIDFYALQGIIMQSLYTSSGDELSVLIANLLVKTEKEHYRLFTDSGPQSPENNLKYYNDFSIDKETLAIQNAKIRDIKGQWIADVKYQYNKGNEVKKIELMGIDSERNFSLEINVVKKEIKDYIEIKFDKF